MKVSEETMKQLMARNPFNQYLDMQMTELEEGHTKGYIKLQPHHLNVYEGVHGGCLYALADALAGIASATYGHFVTTVNGTINYLAAAKDTECIYCEANVVKAGKTIIVVDYTISGDDGKLFCTGTFHYFVLEQEFDKALLEED